MNDELKKLLSEQDLEALMKLDASQLPTRLLKILDPISYHQKMVQILEDDLVTMKSPTKIARTKRRIEKHKAEAIEIVERLTKSQQ